MLKLSNTIKNKLLKNKKSNNCISQPPELQSLFIDKISMTVDVNTESWGGYEGFGKEGYISERFKYLENNGLATSKISRKHYFYGFRIFLNEYGTGKHGQRSITIHWDPKKSSYDAEKNFLRVEFNPNTLSPGEVRFVLDSVFDGGYTLIMDGTLTRIDLSIEVNHRKPEEVVFYYPNIRNTTMKYGEKGDLQSVYLGDKNSTHWLVYDKNQKRMEKNRKCKYDQYAIPVPKDDPSFPDYPVTRFERSFYPESVSYTLDSLQQDKNPFHKLFVVECFKFDELELPKKYKKNPEAVALFRFFLDSCEVRGLQSALKILPTNYYRNQYLKILEDAKADWWDGVEIWNQLPQLIQALKDPIPTPLSFPFPIFKSHSPISNFDGNKEFV